MLLKIWFCPHVLRSFMRRTGSATERTALRFAYQNKEAGTHHRGSDGEREILLFITEEFDSFHYTLAGKFCIFAQIGTKILRSSQL